MRPPKKLQMFANFWPQKCYNPLSPPVLSRFISASQFVFPKLKMKSKGLQFADDAEIQEAVTDKLKKVQKEEFLTVFRNCTTAQKPVYMPMELILKRYVSSIFKKNQAQNFRTALCTYLQGVITDAQSLQDTV